MRNYTLKQLQTFVEVAREKSVSRAAERLFVTQPAVSMQIRQLEEAFGLSLIEPSGRNIQLTHAGQEFLTLAIAALGKLKDLEACMAEHVGMKKGRIELGIVSTAKYFVPMLLVRFAKLMPGIDVVLHIENREKILGMLARNELDLVIMGASGHSTFQDLTQGSNSDKVVRYSKCPVLTVHEEPTDEGLNTIVYATSLAEGEREFGYVVKRMQELFRSTVHLVRINTPMNFQPDHIVKPAMIQFARKLMLENYTLNMTSDWDEEKGITNFASGVKANLICMATHGYRGLSHLFMGSIAEDVVNHTTKPVLTYVVRK